jgi:hypothetical protein
MRVRIAFFLLTLAVSGLSTFARAASCGNSTIRGSYAFTIHGQIFPPDGSAPLIVDGVAKTTFDGNGGLTQLDTVAANGDVPPDWRVSTGTYSVNPDCTGTFTVTNDPQPPIHARMIVAQSGNTIHAVVTDPGFATTSDAERVHTSKK